MYNLLNELKERKFQKQMFDDDEVKVKKEEDYCFDVWETICVEYNLKIKNGAQVLQEKVMAILHLKQSGSGNQQRSTVTYYLMHILVVKINMLMT